MSDLTSATTISNLLQNLILRDTPDSLRREPDPAHLPGPPYLPVSGVVPARPPRQRLPVRDLQRSQLHVDLVLADYTLLYYLQVQFAHAWGKRLGSVFTGIMDS